MDRKTDYQSIHPMLPYLIAELNEEVEKQFAIRIHPSQNKLPLLEQLVYFQYSVSSLHRIVYKEVAKQNNVTLNVEDFDNDLNQDNRTVSTYKNIIVYLIAILQVLYINLIFKESGVKL